MEKSIKGTRTEQNLLKAFAGESQARTRYTFSPAKRKRGFRTDRRGLHGDSRPREGTRKTFFQIP